ncbi:unnamed protein product [Effrenium voratum]|uniref:Hint domain-containing protein n=1 Tax=Effrenium voratum TaxID=2562239 RepID=A0AA36MJI8_9DINO|nr:unnamed protein product [Effrenium voratum]
MARFVDLPCPGRPSSTLTRAILEMKLQARWLIGDRVRLRDLTDAKVVRIEAHRKRPYDLVQLTTSEGRFTVSKDHRVAVPGPGCQGAQRADQLSEGDLVIVGGKNQKLTKVSHLQECTVLYEVVFEEDQSVQMFHIESYGLVTFGSAVAAESAASAWTL